MAEIKIEKKSSLWPWIIAGLVIVALLIYFLGFDRTPQTQTTEQTTTGAPAAQSLVDVKENNQTVAAFVSFVEDGKNMALDHAYTSQAITKLSAAINAMAKAINYDVSADLAQADQYAGAITERDFAKSHADSIKKATEIQAGALQKMQQAKYPELADDAAQVKDASNAIKADELTLNQKDDVKGFFDKAANLLQKMN